MNKLIAAFAILMLIVIVPLAWVLSAVVEGYTKANFRVKDLVITVYLDVKQAWRKKHD